MSTQICIIESHVEGLGGHGEQAETVARSPSTELEGVIFPEEVLGITFIVGQLFKLGVG